MVSHEAAPPPRTATGSAAVPAGKRPGHNRSDLERGRFIDQAAAPAPPRGPAQQPTKERIDMTKISHCLWFDGQAEEAAKFYTSLFKNSSLGPTTRYYEGSPGTPGSVMTVEFTIEGEEYLALNAGPAFSFNPAISIVASCETQDEIDDLWQKLSSDGGTEVQCGWVTDKYGVSWQVVPTGMSEMMNSADKEAAQRAFKAMMGMVKIDIAALRRAYDNADAADEAKETAA
jgi:predicted 3-demethylubiquinone-9 3-methyltransferase (glyoxalase superfamily)